MSYGLLSFFFCTTLSCHVTENIIITIANCRSADREIEGNSGDRSSHSHGSHASSLSAAHLTEREETVAVGNPFSMGFAAEP